MSDAFYRVYDTQTPAVRDVFRLAIEDAVLKGHTEWAKKLQQAQSRVMALEDSAEGVAKAVNRSPSNIVNARLGIMRTALARLKGEQP